jgi:hypothetical protein
MIQDTRDKAVLIKQRMASTQSRQKIYVDNEGGKLEFELGDRVFFKISAMKGAMTFGKKGK